MNLRARKILASKIQDQLADPYLREHSLECRDLFALLAQWESGAISGLMPEVVPVNTNATPGVQCWEEIKSNLAKQ